MLSEDKSTQRIFNFSHLFVVGSSTDVVISKLSCVQLSTEEMSKYHDVLETRVLIAEKGELRI